MKARPTVLAPQTISMASAPVAALTPAEKAADRADMAQRAKRPGSEIRNSTDFAERSGRQDLASRGRTEHFSNPSGLALMNSEDAHLLSSSAYDQELQMRSVAVVRPVAVERVSAAKVVALLAEASAPKAKPVTTASTVGEASRVVVPTAQILNSGDAEGTVMQEMKEAEASAEAQAKPVKAASDRPARSKAAARKSSGTVKTAATASRSKAIAEAH